MNSNKFITDYTLLAESSYANFKKLDNKEAIIRAIQNIDSKTGEAERPKSFADYVTEKYNVIAHYTDRVEPSYDFSTGNTVVDIAANAWATPAIPISIGAGVALKKAYDKESGFSATLFQAKGNAENANEYVLAIRGTAGFKDVSADLGDIVGDGLAYEQIVDLYNFYQQLITPANQSYQAAVIVINSASVGWVLAPTRLNITNNVPIFQAALQYTTKNYCNK